jgi:hypothetical protein
MNKETLLLLIKEGKEAATTQPPTRVTDEKRWAPHKAHTMLML